MIDAEKYLKQIHKKILTQGMNKYNTRMQLNSHTNLELDYFPDKSLRNDLSRAFELYCFQ